MQQLSVENYLIHHYPTVENLPGLAKKLLFSTVKSLFHENQINRDKDKLEVHLPSGIWKNAKRVEEDYIEALCKKEHYHLFRKKK